MRRLLLCMMLVVLAASAGSLQAATNHWKVDIQNMEAAWSSGAAIDMTEEGVTWNLMKIPTITGVPSDTFATDPSMRLMQTDGSGSGASDPNVLFTIQGDVTAGQFGSANSDTLLAVRSDYIFIGSANFVDPGVMVYDWSVINLSPNTEYVLTFYSMKQNGRSGKFTANGEEVLVDQPTNDTGIIVVNSDANGDIVGTAEAFTGEFNWAGFEIQLSGPPIITADPEDTKAFVGETFEFSVEAFDPVGGEISYQWYADPNLTDSGDEFALTDGGNVSGAKTDTLTISDAEKSHLIWYYCEISNLSGSVTSEAGYVVLKRFLYHWKLDGDGVEANGTGKDGVLEGGADFVTEGKVGGALIVDGEDDVLRIENLKTTDTDEISIAFWAKPADITGDWKGMIAKWHDGGHTFWIGQHSNNGGLRYSYYPGGEHALDSSNILKNDEWVHIVCTHDGSEQRIYANGGLDVSQGTPGGWIDKAGDLVMGVVPTGGANFFNGLIDDVKITNYAMSGEEVATEYYLVTGESICVEPVAMDFNDDCKVDVADLQIFATKWLMSNLYPN